MCGAAFRAVDLAVFIAPTEISTPTYSANFISTVSCQLLEINLDENRMSGRCRKTVIRNMSKLANECRWKHGIHRIQRPSMSPDLNLIESV